MSGECATVEKIPDFALIIEDFEALNRRLADTTQNSIHISDRLIDPPTIHIAVDDSAKSMSSPDCFTAKCFNLISEFRSVVEQLEAVNDRLLAQVREVER